MKNILSIFVLLNLATLNFSMEKPAEIMIELGEWHNKTPNTYEIEELSPYEDGMRTAATTITTLGNGKLKKINHKISLEPVGLAKVARYRIYNIDDIDDAAILKIEHNLKTNEIKASLNNPKSKEQSKTAVFSLDKGKLKKLNVSLMGNLAGKNLTSSSLNFTTVKSNPRLIQSK